MTLSKRDYRPPADFPIDLPEPVAAPGSGLVCVVTPTVRATLDADERLSFDRMNARLAAFDRWIVAPRSLRLDYGDGASGVIRVPDAAMGSLAAYNRLMLTPWFYRIFAGYRCVLIHQLDCLVFRDDLEAWCARGWSYLGAPWYGRRGRRDLKAVGNGGLSLRRVDDALAVLESDRFHPWAAATQQIRHFAAPRRLRPLLSALGRARRESGPLPLAQRFADLYGRPEDEFWAYAARFFHPGFRLPAPRDALGFAFEARPRTGYAMLGDRLPFGCHAWARMDRQFWTERLAEDDARP